MSLRDPNLGPLGNEGGDMLVKMTVTDYIDRIMKQAHEQAQEMMREVREGFQRIDSRLDGKADKSTVESIANRVGHVEEDVAKLKQTASNDAVLTTRDNNLKHALWGLAATIIAGIVVALVVWALTNHVHWH